VPGRLLGTRAALARVLRGARLVVSAGSYPAAEARRAVPDLTASVVEIPPGVDVSSIVPLKAAERRAARSHLGLPERGSLVVSVSRLVPRKGMDVLIEAASRLAPSYPDLVVAIAGDGREHAHLHRLAAGSPGTVRLLGRVSDEDRAALLGAADVFVMACRNRWLGLEQEGFGIVFLEAAAAAEAMRALLADQALRRRMGRAARKRVEESFDNDVLASRLADALAGVAI